MARGKKDGEREAEPEATIEKVVEESLKRWQTLSMPALPAEDLSPESQIVEYEDDIIQEHTYSPGYKLLIAVVIAAIFSIWLLLSFAQGFAEKRLECGSDDCGHLFRNELALGVALIFVAPFVIWVWRSVTSKRDSGSRIDLGKRQFVWWDGPLPRFEHGIELDKIVRVTLVEADESATLELGALSFEFLGDGNNIELLDTMGNKTTVRGLCVKSTRDWARALKSEFPHIRIETD